MPVHGISRYAIEFEFSFFLRQFQTSSRDRNKFQTNFSFFSIAKKKKKKKEKKITEQMDKMLCNETFAEDYCTLRKNCLK